MSAEKRGDPLRVGIGGPVGSGKTALMDWLCKNMRERWEIAIPARLVRSLGEAIDNVLGDRRRSDKAGIHGDYPRGCASTRVGLTQ